MNRTVKITLLILAAILYFSLCLQNTFVIDGVSIQNENGAADDGKSDSYNVPNDDDPSLNNSKIVLAAVGDIMLSRGVEQKMIARKDWKYPFLPTASITNGADIAFGNLETTIIAGKIIPSGSFTFRTDPKALEGLSLAGFDVLSLANNHMMNFGLKGLESTLQNLDGAGIGHIGAGLRREQIYAPVVKETKGTKFGFLAYTYAQEQVSSNGDIYGTAYADTAKMKAQVTELRKSVDVVVVSMHIGTEYEAQPNAAQKNFARTAVDAGASLIVGHHPHTVETFEKYNDGYIIYSLGNFVFDQMWSEETRLGAIAKVTFENKKISGIEFVPVKIFDYSQPQILTGAQAEMILKRLEITYNK